jgi:alkaline phosphatase
MHLPRCAIVAASSLLAASLVPLASAATVSRLTPPSGLFSFGDPNPPIISRFLPGQRFDLQATVSPDAGATITRIEFLVDNTLLTGSVALTPVTVVPAAPLPPFPAGSTIGTLRAYSSTVPGVHTLTVRATQSTGATVTATGNFEIVALNPALGAGGTRARNIILLIGDGMGIAHRTAARIVANGVSQGKALAPLAMDMFPVTGIVSTSSLNSIVTDSAPGTSCYSTGNKNNNNQEGVFPDDTTDRFDNPRTEYMGEYLARTQGKSLGIVTTADVFDATPAAMAIHTQDRGAGTGICDQYLDESVPKANLTVLLGGGRKWFLPATTAGSARADASDYVLPAELATGWGVARGAIDRGRDLLADFQAGGFTYVANATQLAAIPANTQRLLGLFTLSNMNVALDKIAGRRGNRAVVNDYGFPDQPMLDEMTDKALQVLSRNPNGFVLMVEAASIDKQAHNMDTERWILETIEFDRAIDRCRRFAQLNPDTLVIITADHECAGVNIIGSSTVTNAVLAQRAANNGGVTQLRDNVVGAYELAGFPYYKMLPDGYPETTDVDRRMLIGYAASADRNEDWMTNPQPLRDSQQPFNGTAPLNTYPSGPTNRDTAGGFAVTGQIFVPGSSVQTAVHTASDIPLSALGAGASLFTGVMDNTDVFFKAMQAVLVGAPSAAQPAPVGQRTALDRLVNMSNRAFVGTGAQAMIGGFVIDGTQPRTLLVRAVGPGLAKFGLTTGTLADPMLTIVNSAGNPIFSNDNWETNTNLAALRSASALVGAPALDAGSKDAALLVTLAPGSYSAQVTGVAGATGLALLEIFEAP